MMNFVLACYATFLATGHTLQSKSIKAETIKKYLFEAKTFISKFDLRKRDVSIDEETNKQATCITKVIQEQERFEGLKNRREPYTIAMHKALHERSQLQHKHSKEPVCCDWFLLALIFGFRQIEWCQAKGSGLLTRIWLNDFNDVYAFTMNDIKLYGVGKVELNFDIALKNPHLIFYVKVLFRWQKNNDHGISRWCARNDKKTYLCPIRAWVRILQRFIQLRGIKCKDQPLAIYQNKSGMARNITADVVNNLLRDLAIKTYNLTDMDEIQKFSSHSLRVGACCLLFACGYPPEFIQRVLCWKSDAWKGYVRDLVVTAIKHNLAMLQADTMPQL